MTTIGVIVSAASTVIGTIISGLVALIISGREHDKVIAVMELKIDNLKKKVEKHNNFSDRITILEQSEKAQWKRIDEMKEEK